MVRDTERVESGPVWTRPSGDRTKKDPGTQAAGHSRAGDGRSPPPSAAGSCLHAIAQANSLRHWPESRRHRIGAGARRSRSVDREAAFEGPATERRSRRIQGLRYGAENHPFAYAAVPARCRRWRDARRRLRRRDLSSCRHMETEPALSSPFHLCDWGTARRRHRPRHRASVT
jgi:hypothetical protein